MCTVGMTTTVGMIKWIKHLDRSKSYSANSSRLDHSAFKMSHRTSALFFLFYFASHKLSKGFNVGPNRSTLSIVYRLGWYN